VPGILRLETIATPVSYTDAASDSVNLMSRQALTPETESTRIASSCRRMAGRLQDLADIEKPELLRQIAHGESR
jgi:hypothetical protein